MLHASSTLTMGTPMLDRLATAVGSRSRTIDHSHPAMLDAITTLWASPLIKAAVQAIGRCGTASATMPSAMPPVSICHAVRLSTEGLCRTNMRFLS